MLKIPRKFATFGLMITQTCVLSSEKFNISELEIKLREKFGFTDLPTTAPWVRFRELGSFWQHWNLHNRKCNKTNKLIVSVFSKKCPYPVWNRTEWIKNNNPLSINYDFSRNFFSQAWELFRKCPIPNTFQSFNQNCKYTDDWYRSKNCYLCHSGEDNEDLKYCYGCGNNKDLQFSELTFNSELGIDLLNSHHCFDSVYILFSRNVSSSSFVYDCRNCANCMFCFNLRNKKYCFGNKQLTKKEYEKKKIQWNLKSREIYDKAKKNFADMMINKAWHKFQDIEHQENSFGSYVSHVKNCENCYMLTYHEDCVNVAFCGPDARMILDSLGTVGSELSYYCSLPVYSYQAMFSFSIDHCRFIEYSANCFQCENCFGCCGLVGKKYCIFNKEYTSEEYKKLREEIIEHMKKTGEWGQFFPGYFAPNPYEESFSGHHFSLSKNEQKKLGFRVSTNVERRNKNYVSIAKIPDSVDNITSKDELCTKIFWDEKYHKPFKILPADIKFSWGLGCPLPNTYYMRRIQENFSWMFFDGKLRSAHCGKCNKKIQTSWPEKYDNRVLCEECYLDVLN